MKQGHTTPKRAIDLMKDRLHPCQYKKIPWITNTCIPYTSFGELPKGANWKKTPNTHYASRTHLFRSP